jgi:hypothetical protein
MDADTRNLEEWTEWYNSCMHQLCKICSQYKQTTQVWAGYKCTTCIIQLQLQCAALQESANKSVATCVRESVTDWEQAFDDTTSDHKDFLCWCSWKSLKARIRMLVEKSVIDGGMADCKWEGAQWSCSTLGSLLQIFTLVKSFKHMTCGTQLASS